MASSAIKLPPGFVLDSENQDTNSSPQGNIKLPPGFVLDNTDNQSSNKPPYEGIQKQSVGTVTNVPGATSRAAIRSNPALALAGPLAGLAALGVPDLGIKGIGGQQAEKSASQAALKPNDVESFQSEILRKQPYITLPGRDNPLVRGAEIGVNTFKDMPASLAGFAADTITNPFDALMALAGKAPGVDKLASTVAGSKIGQKVGQVANADIGQTLKKAAEAIPEGINKGISPVRDYAGNKVSAIRQGAKSYWKDEVKAYGDSLDNLATNPKATDLNDLMQNATNIMVKRGLYDPVDGKWVAPLNKVDAQLVRSYTDLARDFKATGKSSVGKIVTQYQKIRDSAAIDTSMGRDARNLANDFLQGAKAQLDLPEFKAANARYSNFKNNFDAIDAKVDVWGNPLKTAKGERFLTKGLSETKEARLTAKIIESKTGQTLKGAKLINAINNLPGIKKLIK